MYIYIQMHLATESILVQYVPAVHINIAGVLWRLRQLQEDETLRSLADLLRDGHAVHSTCGPLTIVHRKPSCGREDGGYNKINKLSCGFYAAV